MSRLIILSLMLLLSGCKTKYVENRGKYNDREFISDQIISQVARELQKEEGLIPCGSGGSMPTKVRMLALAFECHRNLTVDSARDLLIKSVDVFLRAINENNKIQSCLINVPFEPKNVEIRIVIRNPDGSSVSPGQLCLITATDGKFRYDIRVNEKNGLRPFLGRPIQKRWTLLKYVALCIRDRNEEKYSLHGSSVFLI